MSFFGSINSTRMCKKSAKNISLTSIATFKRNLKTILFKAAYGEADN